MVTISTKTDPRPLKHRENADRRTQADRRKSPVDMRLRVGLWYQYHRATRAGEFDPLPRNPYMRARLRDALLPEVHKYAFIARDTNSSSSAAVALANAIDFLWIHPQLGCNAAGEPMAVYTINAISEYLVHCFEVTMIDRRKSDRRAVKAAAS
jgi:hypothetical protein